MTVAGDAGAVDPAEYERRCSFDQVALDTARTMEAVFRSPPLYLRVTKAQIAITDLLMKETASLATALAAAEARADAAERVLAPVAAYARQHPHLDGAEGEIGAFYGPAFRVSISYRDLRAIRDFAAQTAWPAREGIQLSGKNIPVSNLERPADAYATQPSENEHD